MLRKLAFLLSAVIVLGNSCKSDTNVADLKFNLEKGRIYEYDMVWDMNQKIMGQENDIAVTTLYTMEVVDKNETSTTLKGTYEKFAMKMKMMGMEMNIDTDSPATGNASDTSGNPLAAMNKVFAGIKGKSFTLVVDREGKITAVNGFKELLQSMMENIDLPEEEKAQARVSLSDQFNDETIKSQFAMSFTIYPNKEVKVGDSWEKTVSLGGTTPATYVTTFTVREIKDGTVTVDAKTKITGAQEGLKIDGGQTAVMKIESQSGLVTSADFDQKFTGTTSEFTMQVESTGKVKGKAVN